MSRLDDAMSRLAAELAAENEQCRAPFAIEQAVLAEFDRVKRRKRGRIWVASRGDCGLGGGSLDGGA